MNTDKINGDSYAGDGSDILDEVLYRGVIEQAILAGEELNVIIGGKNLHGENGDDVFFGNKYSGYLYGDNGDDVFFGSNDREGDVYQYGQGGSDIFFGGPGTDYISGDHVWWSYKGPRRSYESPDGNDMIFGGGGRDYLYGAGGDDTIVGGEGRDYIYANDGNDVIYAGTDFGDRISGDTIAGGAEYTRGGERSETGIDTLSYANSVTGVSVNIGSRFSGLAHRYDEVEGKTYGDADRIEGIDNIVGSDYADVIVGDSAANVIHSRAGSDVINAGGGDDTVFGGDDDDTISGEAGNDYLNGENGNDVIEGGAGGDAIVGSDGDDTLRGGDGHNYIYGNDGDDVIDGGDWSDVIGGGAGDNVLQGAAGNDRYVVDKSDRGSDTISDRRGNNELLFVDSADGAGYSEGSFSFSRSGDDLTIEADSGNRVVIEDYADSTFSIYYDDASQVQHELVITEGLF